MAREEPTSQAPRILIFGNYGNGNLGDEATLQALLELLRARLPQAEIAAFASNLPDTAARHGIEVMPAMRAIPRGDSGPSSSRQLIKARLQHLGLGAAASGAHRFLVGSTRVLLDPGFEVRCFRTLRRADIFVIGGGGALSEPDHILSSLVFRVFKMTLLARLAGARVLVLNVGAAPIERRSTRMLVRSVLRLAHYRSVRHETSRQLTGRMGSSTSSEVHPDLVYGLDEASRAADAPGTQTVAINVYPHYDGRYAPAGGNRYEHYLDTLTEFTARLLERGHRIVLFPTQVRFDPLAIADLKARLAALPDWEIRREQVVEAEIATVGDVLDLMRSSDVVVSTRFHGVVFSFALGRPVLAIASNPKPILEMTRMGQAEFAFDADEAEPEALLEAFGRLEEARRRSALT